MQTNCNLTNLWANVANEAQLYYAQHVKLEMSLKERPGNCIGQPSESLFYSSGIVVLPPSEDG